MGSVVAVSAPIGGGKTTFVKAIAKQLRDAATIHFDHYERLTQEPADSLTEWMKKGANADDFIVPRLSDDLKRLRAGQSVIDPFTHEEITSTQHIVFEMPMGREHQDTARYIDLLIWIDIPLDLALARKLKEFTGSFLRENRDPLSKNFIAWMDRYLENYLKVVREVLQIQKQRVGATADIIIDGENRFETMVQQAVSEILKKIPYEG
jgi:uridine kinase